MEYVMIVVAIGIVNIEMSKKHYEHINKNVLENPNHCLSPFRCMTKSYLKYNDYPYDFKLKK